MRGVLPVYFILSLITGTSVYIAQKLNVKLPGIVQFYLNDFLIIPILLTVSLVVLRWSKGSKGYEIPIWVILYICSMYALLYEYILPKVNIRYTADVIDVVLYFVSGFVFFILQKNNKSL
ncbi:hypothetical protein [Tenacibaculum ovolyticum]|uniref:hypothetical protein n=1 Tax=Tenacibaculum ovolyticum TaxID=104270 RepID=UPI0004182284|nr:hypothetical protein [Tenacibaculum ovolyticum]